MSSDDIFLDEVSDIANYRHENGYKSDEDVVKTPEDESEEILSFFEKSGFNEFVIAYEEGQEIEIPEDRCIELNRRQRVTVERRVRTLNATLRKRRRPHHADVRDVFSNSSVLTPSGDSHIDSSSSVEVLHYGPLVDEEEMPTRFQVHHDGDKDGDHLFLQSEDGILKGLRSFKTKIPEAGETSIDDLGEPDQKLIEQKAFVELVGLFDSFGLTAMRPDRHKKKSWQKSTAQSSGSGFPAFGVPLHLLLNQDRNISGDKHLRVPCIFSLLLQQLLNTGFNEEGILRVSPALTRLKAVRTTLDQLSSTFRLLQPGSCRPSAETVDLLETSEPAVIAGLVKLFIRELPIPIFTWDSIDSFYTVHRISTDDETKTTNFQLTALNFLVLSLPALNRDVLFLLLDCLQKLSGNSEVNLMNEINLAKVIAPNLFLQLLSLSNDSKRKSQDSTGQNALLDSLASAAHQIRIVVMLMRYTHLLWLVPEHFIMEIRKQNRPNKKRVSSNSSIMKMFTRREKYEFGESDKINDKGSIRVFAQLPSLGAEQASGGGKTSCIVKLDEDLTAADVLLKFCLPEACRVRLYEVGGNICERALSDDVKLEAVYRVNPRAEWMVKPYAPLATHLPV